MCLITFLLTYFGGKKSNYENNLHSPDVMQSSFTRRRAIESGVLATQCAEAAYPIVIWPDWNGLIKSEGGHTPPNPMEQRFVTPSNLLKYQTPLVKTAQCAAPDGGVCLCRSLRPLIPQACLVPFSSHPHQWDFLSSEGDLGDDCYFGAGKWNGP